MSISSLAGEAGDSGADKLLRLLFFIGALRDAGAARVTAVTPYLCYARKDRRTKPLRSGRDALCRAIARERRRGCASSRSTRIMSRLSRTPFASRASRSTRRLCSRAISRIALGAEPVAVVSPDLGGEKRAELFRQRLETDARARRSAKGFMDKHRSMGEITGEIFAGDVDGRAVVILDDLISSGGTMARAARACRAHGATRIFLAATHGLFARDAEATLREAPIEEIIVTDTVVPSEAIAQRLARTPRHARRRDAARRGDRASAAAAAPSTNCSRAGPMRRP